MWNWDRLAGCGKHCWESQQWHPADTPTQAWDVAPVFDRRVVAQRSGTRFGPG